MNESDPIKYYDQEPDHSGMEQYDAELEEAEAKAEAEQEAEQAAYEHQLDEERGEKVAEASNMDADAQRTSAVDEQGETPSFNAEQEHKEGTDTAGDSTETVNE